MNKNNSDFKNHKEKQEKILSKKIVNSIEKTIEELEKDNKQLQKNITQKDT